MLGTTSFSGDLQLLSGRLVTLSFGMMFSGLEDYVCSMKILLVEDGSVCSFVWLCFTYRSLEVVQGVCDHVLSAFLL